MTGGPTTGISQLKPHAAQRLDADDGEVLLTHGFNAFYFDTNTAMFASAQASASLSVAPETFPEYTSSVWSTLSAWAPSFSRMCSPGLGPGEQAPAWLKRELLSAVGPMPGSHALRVSQSPDRPTRPAKPHPQRLRRIPPRVEPHQHPTRNAAEEA